MGFENTKRKLQSIRNRQIQNEIKAERQKIENAFIEARTKNLSPNHSTFKRIRDLSTEWQTLTIATFFDGIENINVQYTDFEVVLERYDERYIPFINVQILYRQVGGGDDGITLVVPNQIHYFELEDIQGETTVKKVTIRASLYFDSESFGQVEVENLYEAKLMITFRHHQDST